MELLSRWASKFRERIIRFVSYSGAEFRLMSLFRADVLAVHVRLTGEWNKAPTVASLHATDPLALVDGNVASLSEDDHTVKVEDISSL